MHILSILAFSSAPLPISCAPAQDPREQAKANRLLPRQDSTQLTDFFKIPQILRALLVRDVTRTL